MVLIKLLCVSQLVAFWIPIYEREGQESVYSLRSTLRVEKWMPNPNL